MAEGGAPSVVARIRSLAALQLREEFPYMKSAALDKLLDKITNTIDGDIIEQEPEMEAAKKRTSFFSLSAELRNTIYELALVNKSSIVIHRIPITNPVGPRRYSSTKTPALLAVSRQIRHEAAAIYYGANSFLQAVHTPNYRPDSRTALALWLKSLPDDHAALIKGMEFRLINRDGPASNLLDILRHVESSLTPDLDDELPGGRSLHQMVLLALGLADAGPEAVKIQLKCAERASSDVVDLYDAVRIVNKDSKYRNSDIVDLHLRLCWGM
ncbi:hypothetical protein Slin14017_G055190 [Septoria linicola]|nr:hypothetical protein Slin14017_G055190 [Septoria linicola]